MTAHTLVIVTVDLDAVGAGRPAALTQELDRVDDGPGRGGSGRDGLIDLSEESFVFTHARLPERHVCANPSREPCDRNLLSGQRGVSWSASSSTIPTNSPTAGPFLH